MENERTTIHPSPSATGAPDRARAARVFREEASRHGFARCGVAAAGPAPEADRFRRWLEEGRHAGMRYLAETADARADTEAILPGARSVICLADVHARAARVAADGATVARYAAGPDYHGALRARAERLAREAARRIGGSGWTWRVCVDSTPLAERSFAAAAGLGWIGKNGCLIDEELGSFFLLAEIVTDLDLPPDDPVAERCGACVRCLDACPTGAFVEPGILDAARCIAYWTIEHRGAIPDAIKPALGTRVFGCDDCQEACPWNAPLLPPAEAGDAPPTRVEWLAMGPGRFRREFGATAMNRAGRRGIQRNAAISAGCEADSGCREALERGARAENRELADASRWAFARLPETGNRKPETGTDSLPSTRLPVHGYRFPTPSNP